MNCPRCGSEHASDQKFCRKCGASLSLGIQPLPVPPANSPKWRPEVVIIDDPFPRARRVMYGFIILFIGVAIALTGKMLIHEDFVTVIGVLASLAGMFFSAFPYLSPARPQRYDITPADSPEELAPAAPTKKLPQMNDIDFVPSVTEGTTDLLKSPITHTDE